MHRYQYRYRAWYCTRVLVLVLVKMLRYQQLIPRSMYSTVLVKLNVSLYILVYAKLIKLFVSQSSFFSLTNVALMPENHFCTFSSDPLLKLRFSNENVISERAPSAQSHSHRWSSVSLPLYAGRSCFILGCFSLRGKRYGLQSLRAFIVLGSADWACWRDNVEGNWEMRWRFFFFLSRCTSQLKRHTRGHKGIWVDTREQIVVWNVKQCLS